MRRFFWLPLCFVASCSCGSPVPDGNEGEGDGAEGEGDGAGEGEGEGETPNGMVEVPAGPFLRGCGTCQDDEAPQASVTLSRFFVDITEVTQGAYQACVEAGACAAPPSFDPVEHPHRPVTSMTWNDAVAFCAFLDKRLPTEAEWEKAARGTDGRRYPWGDAAADCAHANTTGCADNDDAVDVGSLPQGASPWGALDMAGNVWEWTADFYAADAYVTQTGPDPGGPSSGAARVYRGGSSGNGSDLATTTNRADTYAPDFGGTGLGFRCVQDG